jgi:hypothetical protein
VTRLYLSGPVSHGGHLDDRSVEQNIAEFHAASKRLRDAGYHVANPAELTEHLAVDEPWEAFMRLDLAAMLECEGVALLPYWQRSRGARLEQHLALELGLDVRTVEHWLMDAYGLRTVEAA